MRSVGGLFPTPKNPSTALRAVPLPRKTGGGFRKVQSRHKAECRYSLTPSPAGRHQKKGRDAAAPRPVHCAIDQNFMPAPKRK
jgi:hypothetical protein